MNTELVSLKTFLIAEGCNAVIGNRYGVQQLDFLA